MADRTTFEVTMGPTGPKERRDPGEPMRIVIMSDLSRPRRSDSTLSKPLHVSIDNLEAVLEQFAPVVTLPSNDLLPNGGTVVVKSFDNFHADHVAHCLPDLLDVLGIARRLDRPDTEQAAMAEFAALTGQSAPSENPPNPKTAPKPPTTDDELFERLLGQKHDSDQRRTHTEQKVQNLIRDALGDAGDVQIKASSGLAKLTREQVHGYLSRQLRAALQCPELRDLERAWRSIEWLVTRIEDNQAQIYLLDLSRDGLAHQIQANADALDRSELHRILSETDEYDWDVIVGDYSFGLDLDDLSLLASIGAIAARAGAPFIAGAELSLAGCVSAEALESPWDWSTDGNEAGPFLAALRAHPAAQWLGLALPRFLLRYPYGPKTDPIETFPFDELPVPPFGEDFLWANAAFACALMAVEAHAEGGADWPATATAPIEDLPMPVYADGTGDAIQAPLEYLLNERARGTADQAGLIVLAGGRNTNRISTSGLHPFVS